MQKDDGIKHIYKAVGYSWNGLKSMVTEIAFRQEMIAALFLLPMAWLLPGLDLLWRMLLTFLWMAMPTAELINTAIEAVVDLACPEWHPLAKRAKDLGSAAVLMTVVANFIGWAGALWLVLLHFIK
ncbi:MAG: diacylglycerol kinase [Victivallales bacterium]|nr:diacylglycerol kinase [Victivallales bacterium]